MKIMKPKKRLLSVFLVLAVLFSAVFSGAYASGGGALGGGGSTSSGSGGSSGSWSHNYYLDDLMIYNKNDEPAEDLQEAAYALCHIDYHLEANVDLYLAAYADDGKLVSIDKHSDFLDFGAGIESTSITVLEMTSPELYINSGDQAVDEIRIFIWDKKMKPLSNVLSSKDSSNIEGDRSVTLELSQIVTDDFDYGPGDTFVFPDDLSYLEFYDDEAPMGSQRYNLKTSSDQTADPDIYINGVLCEDNAAAALSKYIINRHMGEIKLVDLAPADGIYDTIYTDYHITGEISAISPETGKIFLTGIIGNVSGRNFIPDDNTVFFLDGEEITASELMIGDIVSVEFDVNDTLDYSPFYRIFVSRDISKGTLTRIDYDEQAVYFDEIKYFFADNFNEMLYDITLGDPYKIYFDYFGAIFKCVFDSSSLSYGIIDKYTYNALDDDYTATIYTSEGDILNCLVDGTKATVIDSDGSVLASRSKSAVQTALRNKVYINGSSTNGKQDVKDRAVIYKISSGNL